VGGAWLNSLLLPVARALHPVESALGRHARAEDRVQAAAERTRQPGASSRVRNSGASRLWRE
jgi:hypothetical protein